jgi:hypothetical protein
VCGMCSICTEGGAGCPALGGEDAMAEAGSVVGPSSVLGIVGDAGTASNYVSMFVSLRVRWRSHTSSVPQDPL